jgi:hypothetical protein
MKISATYSPEDNKIRLYASARLDAETYARVKAAGFKWAPKQELFVAPAWSPAREDLAIELAGEIEAEESTLAERAAAKAERLENLADKRRRDANAFSAAAHRICERFAGGQPILVGHHSERRARKDQEKADNAMRKAVAADKAAGWWLYKASSVQHHANRKNRDDVRARRIKTLLAELRDLQRDLNHAYLALQVWAKLETPEQIMRGLGGSIKTGQLAHYGLWSDVNAERVSHEEAKARTVAGFEKVLNSDYRRRWIEHTLNRLSYERELLGEVPIFTGTITPVMLQEFAREHGAAGPKGSVNDDGKLTLSSVAPLPAHIGDGLSLTLSQDEWRTLMQSCGYEAVAKAEKKAASKSKLAPLLNVDAETINVRNRWRGTVDVFSVARMTKAEFARIHSDHKGTSVSECGQFRVRMCIRNHARVAVFITDSKAHPTPKKLEVV